MQVGSYVEYTNPKKNPILRNFLLYKIDEITPKGVRVRQFAFDDLMDGVYPAKDFTEVSYITVFEMGCAIWRVEYTGELLKRRDAWDKARQAFTANCCAINGGLYL